MIELKHEHGLGIELAKAAGEELYRIDVCSLGNAALYGSQSGPEPVRQLEEHSEIGVHGAGFIDDQVKLGFSCGIAAIFYHQSAGGA